MVEWAHELRHHGRTPGTGRTTWSAALGGVTLAWTPVLGAVWLRNKATIECDVGINTGAAGRDVCTRSRS